ncbi:hypothetical protein GLOIN_2v1641446 [Rhizophagus irregularis DAOM 181602=DAOM 197198]|nr:hypothetical protein GLOIN_2v1641446 [Rhizophagus irregularis DAOM 181602=DAOM 197198]
MKCGASSFKIIQTSKGRRKLVAYFENWETTLRALNTHSFSYLMAKNTLNTNKSGKSDKILESNQPKKKDKPSSSKEVSKNNNQEKKHPNSQKKAKNSSKNKVIIKTTRWF